MCVWGGGGGGAVCRDEGSCNGGLCMNRRVQPRACGLRDKRR